MNYLIYLSKEMYFQSRITNKVQQPIAGCIKKSFCGFHLARTRGI